MTTSFTATRARTLMLGTAPTALAVPSLAWAQNQPAPAQPSATAATSSDNGNEIIITAQRRAERLEDVPMSVAVVSQETLSNVGVNNVRDLQNVTSEFMVNNSGSYPQPAVRGVTTINAGAYENNVALFVDGLYQYTAQILNMDMPNIKSIQVLKGPQGTLYGRNATGGAILIDTLDPSDVFGGNFEVTYGRFDDIRARGYISGPLGKGIGFSLAGTTRNTTGYFKKASRTIPGQFDGRTLGLQQDSLRGKLKFDLSNSFRATLAYSYGRGSDPRAGVIFTPIENVPTDYLVAGRDTRPRGLGEVAGDAFAIALTDREAMLKLEYDTGIGTLRSVSGYTKTKLRTTFDLGGSYVADSYNDSLIHDRIWQEALDFTVNAIDKLDLIVGGTYYNIYTNYDPNIPLRAFTAPPGSVPGTALSLYRKASDTYFYRTKEAWAAFVDATFHATDRLSINVGGRYSKETQDVSSSKNNFCTTTAGCLVGGVLVPLGGLTTQPFDRTPGNAIPDAINGSSYSKFTPRASIRYEIAPRTNIYASYSKGFRAGEWNSTVPNDNPANWFALGQIGQETVDAFEVGLKTARRRVRFDVAGFYYDYKHLQVSYTQFVNGVAQVVLQSVPKAKIYGAEANVDAEVVDNLNLRAGATWLHARYGDGAIFNASGVNTALPGFNINSDPLKVFPNITVAQDISGKQMSRAPNFTAFLGFDYLIPQGEGGLRLAANAKYTSSYVVTNPGVWGGEPIATFLARLALDPKALPNNDSILAGTPYVSRASQQRARQGGYVLLNASVTWTNSTDHYYIRLWGNNLTDKKYRIHYNPTSTGTYAPIGEPFTFGVTAGFKFRNGG